MDEIKQICERKLQSAQWARRWLIIPCTFLSVGMLVSSLILGTFTMMWVAILGFNLVNLWFNSQMQKLYTSALNSTKEYDQQARIRELNPHRK